MRCPALKPAASSTRISRRYLSAGRSLRWPRSPLLIFFSAISPKPICTAAYPSFSFVRTYVTWFCSVAMTVTPTAEPSSLNIWSMPIFRPRIIGFLSAGASPPLAFSSVASTCSSAFSSAITISLELDLDVDARRKVELHQRVDRLLRWVIDVDEPLVRPDLELLARVLVDERAANDRELLDACRQRYRTGHRRTSALRGLDDLRGGLIDQLVVVRLEPDPDALLCHLLSQDLRDDARAHGPAAFADGEAQALLQGDRRDQGDGERGVVPGHDHLGAGGQLGRAGHVGGPDVELGTVAVEEGRVPPTFL